jgi:hypothetical protein
MTPTHRKALAEYKLQPVVINATDAESKKILTFFEDGSVEVNLEGVQSRLSASQIFDMVLPTMFGLNEALVHAEDGGFLRKKFEDEFAGLNRLLEERGQAQSYGNYVFYPERQHLVQFAPPYWHRLSLVASNAQLYRDPDNKMNWEEVREIFQSCSVAVAGASVGSKIADSIIKVLRPEKITIADPAVYKLTNGNRTDICYDDIVYSAGTQHNLNSLGEFAPYGMKNKAISFALRNQRLDPYLQIFPISRGITAGNVEDFVSAADVIVEEVDMSFDMEIKVAIRAEARKQRKLFLMISDLGSWVQWDIRPFHLNSDIPLFLSCSDDKIFSLNRAARDSKDNFFDFMEGLIDRHFWQSGEFGETLSGRLAKVVGSMPQLGSTTSVAAGLGAEFVARLVLGYRDIFESGIVDMRQQEIRTFGKKIGDL